MDYLIEFIDIIDDACLKIFDETKRRLDFVDASVLYFRGIKSKIIRANLTGVNHNILLNDKSYNFYRSRIKPGLDWTNDRTDDDSEIREVYSLLSDSRSEYGLVHEKIEICNSGIRQINSVFDAARSVLNQVEKGVYKRGEKPKIRIEMPSIPEMGLVYENLLYSSGITKEEIKDLRKRISNHESEKKNPIIEKIRTEKEELDKKRKELLSDIETYTELIKEAENGGKKPKKPQNKTIRYVRSWKKFMEYTENENQDTEFMVVKLSNHKNLYRFRTKTTDLRIIFHPRGGRYFVFSIDSKNESTYKFDERALSHFYNEVERELKKSVDKKASVDYAGALIEYETTQAGG
jgi:hypothetical protein